MIVKLAQEVSFSYQAYCILKMSQNQSVFSRTFHVIWIKYKYSCRKAHSINDNWKMKGSSFSCILVREITDSVLCALHTLLETQEDFRDYRNTCNGLTEQTTRTFPLCISLWVDVVQMCLWQWNRGRNFKLHLLLASTKQERGPDSRSKKLFSV